MGIIYNARKLRGRIAESGLLKKDIARAIGITPQGLLNKIDGKTEFTASEIGELQALLELTNEERDEIFFCSDVG